jgi:hypothetical protein
MALATGHLLPADLATTASLHGNGFPAGVYQGSTVGKRVLCCFSFCARVSCGYYCVGGLCAFSSCSFGVNILREGFS